MSRRNARNRARIDAERAVLGPLPGRRSDGFEETLVRVTSTGGFTLRRVFYTVPSRLVGHRVRVRLYDDRLVLYAGTEELMALPRGHAGPGGRRGRVVNYRHVLPSLRCKPMALLKWVYRDGLFPRDAYRRAFDVLLEDLGGRQACSRMVDLLALAHDHCCEAQLAAEIDRGLGAGALPDPELLRKRFPPTPNGIPDVGMALPPVADYDDLRFPRPCRRRTLMNDPFVVDPPQLDLLLKQLRLPTMRTLWRSFTERADREGWSSARLLFELIGARYENRSLLVIANEPFSAWGKIFGSDAMTLAAVDRLVHRSHIFELNVESYRRRAAIEARRAAAGAPADEKHEGGPE